MLPKHSARRDSPPASRITILLKRAYEPPAPIDGFRILVDRLWPRGVAKSSARIDLWLKEVAPTTSLRKWFGHDPSKWAEFQTHYYAELALNPDPVAKIIELANKKVITLIYGARDTEYNHAIVLKSYVEKTRKHSQNPPQEA
ncbi:DUF488 domain-containing protein [Methylobacillus caricis]|uniref:DUF488 domain-containing protein n=1 Tax=Methylobacillus caricis TaxID=1971611 RepID=UPI001CFFA62B|nr:DUF488 domain-containing protein [Methylobacillus caricis]MCB5187193.1 DUF488 domain-containing protein [Methylobacillus caricis]